MTTTTPRWNLADGRPVGEGVRQAVVVAVSAAVKRGDWKTADAIILAEHRRLYPQGCGQTKCLPCADAHIVKTCPNCGARHDQTAWALLARLGRLELDEGVWGEMRNCSCGSTIVLEEGHS